MTLPYETATSGKNAIAEKQAIRQAQISVYSILRDWIKGQVAAVETGMLSFEGAILGQILLSGGGTVLD